MIWRDRAQKALSKIIFSFSIIIFPQVSKLLIPTAETARQEYFLHACLNHDVPLLLLGPTGTGKSALTSASLIALPKDKFIINTIHFSARTSAGQAQDIIMSKVDR